MILGRHFRKTARSNFPRISNQLPLDSTKIGIEEKKSIGKSGSRTWSTFRVSWDAAQFNCKPSFSNGGTRIRDNDFTGFTDNANLEE